MRPLLNPYERAWVLAFLRAVAAGALAFLGVALALALWSYDPGDPGFFSATWREPQNWLGDTGARAGDLLHRSVGVAGYLLAAYALIWAVRIHRRAAADRLLLRLICAPLAMLGVAALASGEPEIALSGGGLGGLIGDTLFASLNTVLPLQDPKIRYIAAIVLLTLLIPPLLLTAVGGSVRHALHWLKSRRLDAVRLGGSLKRWLARRAQGLASLLGAVPFAPAAAGVAAARAHTERARAEMGPIRRLEEPDFSARHRPPMPKAPPPQAPQTRAISPHSPEPHAEPPLGQASSTTPTVDQTETRAPRAPSLAPPLAGWAAEAAAAGDGLSDRRRAAELAAADRAQPVDVRDAPAEERINEERGEEAAAPMLHEDASDREATIEQTSEDEPLDIPVSVAETVNVDRVAPPPPAPAPVAVAEPLDTDPPLTAEADRPALSLLTDPSEATRLKISERELALKADRLQEVLQDYGVRGDIIHVNPGPVVSLFELEPAPGLKASRVIGLAEDIGRSMGAAACRIAPVPGKNLIGVELPNEARETVLLSELIGSDAFQNGDWTLPLALGKDIAGEPVIADLATMPHLLIAGTTGSGKSVAINTMLLSLLYRLAPEDVRLILIDPKMLELSVYNGAPHLMAPVVTDPNKAVSALRWVVREMESRYQRMARLNVRSLESYNARVAEAMPQGAREATLTQEVQVGFDPETGAPLYETKSTPAAPMPRIVVVIDEMADLMLVAGKEIERLVQRLAQMARAAGIHLVMATQRPSVDVITGVIKANFPIRISFQVTSKIDSRTIINEPGAEQLLGKGDMLFTTGSGKLRRLHGPFVSDAEVEAVATALKRLGPASEQIDFDARPETTEDTSEPQAGAEEDGDQALYDKALNIVKSEGKASTSFLQRRLNIGYNRAARLVDRLESEGVVSAANHVGKREVLISPEA
ncbi:MAG: DNA translocase FtsK 4TM domain-containing protein [Pseudomonadota bacterium]